MADVFANNATLTTASSSGTTAPASGTSEAWTVVALSALWPNLAAGQTMSIQDPNAQSEIIRITSSSGSGDTTLTVTRGADGTTPVAHSTGATFVSTAVASWFNNPAAPAPNPAPASVLDLRNQYIGLPITDPASTPNSASVLRPQLDGFWVAPFFVAQNTLAAGNSVYFQANVEGVTTSGSSYPRSELREMYNSGTLHANWSTNVGTHIMTIVGSTVSLPPVKPQVVIAQIHDASQDVIQIEVNGGTYSPSNPNISISWRYLGSTQSSYLTQNYTLGTTYTIEIHVAGSSGTIQIYYNSSLIGSQSYVDTGCYFKAGCYTQSNTTDDTAGAFGATTLSAVNVSHSPANSVDPTNIVFNSGSGTGYVDIPGGLTTVIATSTHTTSYGETTICTSGTFTDTLPAPLANGECWVNNSGAGTITVSPPSGVLYTQSGSSGNISMAQGVGHHFVSDGTNWYASA